MDQNPSALSCSPPSAAIAPAWEDRSRPLWERWWLTERDALVRPALFFDAMPPRGSIVPPLVFALTGGLIAAATSALVQGAFAAGSENGQAPAAVAGSFVEALGSQVAIAKSLLLAPVRVALLVFVAAALVHSSLIFFGGARRRFETTFRVVGYSAGATQLLGLLPLVGAIVAVGWACAAVILGLKRAHGTTLGRAATATLVSLALLFSCVLLPARHVLGP